MEASRLVGTFGARTADELERVLQSDAARQCDLLELRLDLLSDERLPVERLVAAAPRPVIATYRPRRRGATGAAEEARLAILARAAAAGAEWIDVEEHVPAERVPAGANVLRSVHVDRLPRDAEDWVARLLEPPAAAAKLVARVGDAADALRALTLVHENPGRLVCHVGSAPFTRFGGALLGAPITYTSLRPGGTIGLALPTVTEALRKWRFRRLTPGARAFLLLGESVDGSVSPAMLNRAFEDLGVPLVSLPWSCDDAAPGLVAVERFGWAGAAVTIPHKARAHDLVAAWGGMVGEAAAELGVVNTVLRADDGRLAAHNTDVPGLLEALWPHVPPDGVAGRSALVLGAGGAARAAVRALQQLGAEVVVHARRPEAAAELAALGVRAAADARDAVSGGPVLVVDATPAGKPGGVPFLDPAPLPPACVVLDMLVSERPTAFVAAARAAGLRAVEGADMLLHQAAHQVRLLTGGAPDRERMGEAGRAALRARDRHVVLLGLRCAGKSQVGEPLAQLLARPLVDTDVEIELRAGRSPEQMILDGDEAAFREAETAMLRDLVDTAPAVISTGGGAALHDEALRALCSAAFVVLLDAPDAVLLERLAAEPRAPLTDLEPTEELARQRAERMAIYRECADLTVDTSSADPSGSVEEIAAALDLAGIGTGAAPSLV